MPDDYFDDYLDEDFDNDDLYSAENDFEDDYFDDYLDEDFDFELDSTELAFALGISEEMAEEQRHTHDEQNNIKEERISLKSRHKLSEGGRPFEQKVKRFISDLKTGHKKFGDKL